MREKAADYLVSVSILARPRRTGALTALTNWCRLPWFQSSPAHVGRALRQDACRLAWKGECFNPRPPT